MKRTVIAIVVGALSASMASGVLAQNDERRFIEADTNGDGYLSQQEAEDGLDMDQESFEQADSNDDDRLTLQEYLSAVNQEGGQQQAGQAEGATVQVQQEAADIEVEQEPPTVTVEQQSPDVTITQPAPEVQIEQAQPNVEVQQAEPEVSIERQGEPEVQIERSGEADVEMQREEGQQQDQQQQEDQQQTQTTTEQQATGERESSLMSMQASELEGMTVVTNQGEEMGDIDRIARHTQSGQLYGIVSTGGFLGFGAEELAIPLEALEVQGDQLVSQQERSEEQLRSAAEEYREEDFEEVDGDQRLSEARGGSS